MPTIQTKTARGQSGVLNVPTVSPESFGSDAGRSASQFGQTVMAVDQKIQAQQDEVDLVGKAGDYNIRLSQLPAEIMADDTLDTHDKRVAAYKSKADEFRTQLNEDASPAVQRSLSMHATQALSAGIVGMETESRTQQVQQLRVDIESLQDRLAGREAGQIAVGDVEGAGNTRLERQTLLARSVERGIHSPKDAATVHARVQNNTWEAVAQQNPDYILRLADDVMAGGAPPAGMDGNQMHHYTNIAIGTISAKQSQVDHIRKLQEAEVKANQDLNARNLTADLLEGKPIGSAIPTLLRSRGLDDGVGRTLAELQQKLISAPDMSKYQRELAPQIEASLGALKYSTTGLDDSIEQGLVSDFTQGHILKEEFTHLMSVLRGVQDYRNQGGKESHNQDVSHAHSNLERKLRIVGEGGKYLKPISEQTIAEAEQYYFRRINQQPDADPWKVMEEAINIFRPGVEKELGVNTTEKAVLNDARMQGLAHAGAITPAAHKAYKDKSQNERGWNAVQQALKDLPPPPPPGFFERLRGLLPSKKSDAPKGKERKAPGVMGE